MSPSSDSPTTTSGGSTTSSSARVIAPLVFGGLTYAVAQTTIVPVVPQIQAATGADAGDVTWVITGFFVSSAALTVVAGRLGDLFGKKPVLLAVLALFGVGSVVAAVGGSLGAVVAGRVIMGTAGGVFPLSFAILGQHLPRDRAAFGMGLISSMFGLGGALGLPVGGLVADHLGYQGLFWGTAGMTVVSLVGIAVFVPGTLGSGSGRVDWGGALLLAASLGGMLTAISKGADWGWASAPVLGLFGAGVLALVVLVLVEQRIRDPLIDLALMRRRNVWVANLTACLVTVGQATSFLLIPQVVQMPAEGGVGLGVGVSQAGLFMLPAAIATMLAGPLTGRAVARFGMRPPLVVGAVATAAGLVVLAAGGAQPVAILVGAAVMGIGGGTAFAVLPMLISEAVPVRDLGAANGVNTIVRHISMAVAAQVAAAVLVLGTPAGELYPVRGAFVADFGVSALLGVLALLLVPLVRARPDRAAEESAPHPAEAEKTRC
ncbi:MFS family permease [Spinactinospora alkalitolerans]|uniref:MFS family permease n=1 Tax=Spinactinospora alkalitolerans TaxID=687207 RepID=A0A852TW41_9ACTN|nr:MFS transporter [Spinactinospora alkalitolerans]NYE48148.1 MFS family permease [Spinactinospora alkalitolerans]